MLAELEKLKKGDFSDDLLPSVVNNLKLDFYQAMEYNMARTNYFLQSFVNNEPWEQFVKTFDRISGITKQQIVDFAQRHFRDNYVAVYKRQGVDPNQKKIDKPEITPIPTNRDTVSQFVKDIQQIKVKPIEPRFVDFQKDLTFSKTDNGLPVVSVQNTENGRFELAFRYDFGDEADTRYNYAASYLDYIGTDSLTAEQVRQQFYKLACSHYISVEARSITVWLTGLSENMPQALQLLEHLMQHAKVDQEAYQQYIAIVNKSRADSKLDQQSNFGVLRTYGMYGTYNRARNILTGAQLQQTNPQDLLDVLKHLQEYEHTVLYYGPQTDSELAAVISQYHAVPATLKPLPEVKHYTKQLTPQNEILIAPYDAKNIYMQMYHIEPLKWNPDEAAVKALFNEYYGGSMGSVVFQEIRESRGLAYNAFAGYIDPTYKDDDTEFAIVHIISQNDKMMDCIRQFHQILDTIPQSEGAFAIAKEAVKKKIASNRTTKFELISAWLAAKALGIDYDQDKPIYEALDKITLQDIVNFEQQRMAHKTWRYVILGNEKELDMASLEKIAPIRRLTLEEIFGY